MTSYLSQYGAKLIDQGYQIVPIRARSKHPGIRGWQKVRADGELLDRWTSNEFKNGGVGIQTKHTPAIDIDVLDQEISDKLAHWCETNLGASVCRVGKAPKRLFVFRTDRPFTKFSTPTYVDCLENEHKIEVLGDGQQFVAYAVHPGTNKPYEWVSENDLASTAYEALPTLSVQQIETLFTYFQSILPKQWQEKPKTGSCGQIVDTSIPVEDRILANATAPTDLTLDQIKRCLHLVERFADEYHDWVKVGMALYHQFNGNVDGLSLWDEWSRTGAKYDPAAINAKWKTFNIDLSARQPVTFATIIQMAKKEHAAALTATQTAFKLVHARDVRAKLGPINWRIESVLEENTTGLIFGDPGAYKSFLAVDMAFHVGAGRDWHGMPVSQGSVVYIAGEGHGGLARRFAAWEQYYGLSLDGLPIYVSEQAAQLSDVENAKQVVGAVDEVARVHGAPAMIVIDTLARNFGAGDENSNTDMGLFVNHVDSLLRARYGATVVIVHHSGHSHKQRARGAAALKGGMDFEYRVEKHDAGTHARLVCTKMKDAIEPPEMWFERREIMIGGFDEDAISSLVFTKTDPPVEEEKPLSGNEKTLYDIIDNEAPITRETLYDLLKTENIFPTNRAMRDTLRRLINKEQVVENDGYLNTYDGYLQPEVGGFRGEN